MSRCADVIVFGVRSVYAQFRFAKRFLDCATMRACFDLSSGFCCVPSTYACARFLSCPPFKIFTMFRPLLNPRASVCMCCICAMSRAGFPRKLHFCISKVFWHPCACAVCPCPPFKIFTKFVDRWKTAICAAKSIKDIHKAC